jgi:hypothetical protein
MPLTILSALWLTAVGAAFLIVKVFKIGPIIYTISAEHGWGVHGGDFLALIPLTFALMITLFFRKSKAA